MPEGLRRALSHYSLLCTEQCMRQARDLTLLIPVALAPGLAHSWSFLYFLNEERRKERILGGIFVRGSTLGGRDYLTHQMTAAGLARE